MTAQKTANIRIKDLANPQVSDEVRSFIEAVEQQPVLLEEEPLLAQAQAETGLDNFGSDDFRERLRIILQAMNDDKDMSPLGHANRFFILLRYLKNRLLLEDLWRRHPEIDEVQIRAPIIIAGLPRGGTTHMVNLISADHSLRSLPYWESLEPVPMPGEKPGADGEDPRIRRCRENLLVQDRSIPYFKNMHEMTVDHIHEEIELMGCDFTSMIFENYGILPAWRDYYLSHDQRPGYRYLRRILKTLQWFRGPERWVLKSPQHSELLPILFETFPDATVVLPHRDPVAIVISMSTMISYVARLSHDPVRPEAFTAYWGDRFKRMLEALVRDRDLVPAEQTLDVNFDDFMANDVATVEKVYKLAGHPMTDKIRTNLQHYMDHHPRGRFGRILYDPEELGMDLDWWRDQFRFYLDRFQVRTEY